MIYKLTGRAQSFTLLYDSRMRLRLLLLLMRLRHIGGSPCGWTPLMGPPTLGSPLLGPWWGPIGIYISTLPDYALVWTKVTLPSVRTSLDRIITSRTSANLWHISWVIGVATPTTRSGRGLRGLTGIWTSWTVTTLRVKRWGLRGMHRGGSMRMHLCIRRLCLRMRLGWTWHHSILHMTLQKNEKKCIQMLVFFVPIFFTLFEI